MKLLGSQEDRFQSHRDNFMEKKCPDSLWHLWIDVSGIKPISQHCAQCMWGSDCGDERKCLCFAEQARNLRGNRLLLSSRNLDLRDVFVCWSISSLHKTQQIPKTPDHLVISITAYLLIKEKHPTTIAKASKPII